jgi:hypothetical protein
MIETLLAAAAMAAVAYAVVPADAAKIGEVCSGANLAKAETMIETMADGEAKFTSLHKGKYRQRRMPCWAARWALAACILARSCAQAWRSNTS